MRRATHKTRSHLRSVMSRLAQHSIRGKRVTLLRGGEGHEDVIELKMPCRQPRFHRAISACPMEYVAEFQAWQLQHQHRPPANALDVPRPRQFIVLALHSQVQREHVS